MDDVRDDNGQEQPVQPVIDMPEVAVSGILNAMLKLGPRVTREQQRSLLDQLGRRFSLEPSVARDLAVLGNWLASQPASPAAALQELTDTLHDMPGCRAREAYASLGAMADAIFGTEAPDTNDRIQRLLPPTP